MKLLCIYPDLIKCKKTRTPTFNKKDNGQEKKGDVKYGGHDRGVWKKDGGGVVCTAGVRGWGLLVASVSSRGGRDTETRCLV